MGHSGRWFATTGVILALVLTGCGDGDGEGGDTTAATRTEPSEPSATTAATATAGTTAGDDGAPPATLAEPPPGALGAGAVPPDEFPTVAGIDFDRFPRRLVLPPQPGAGGQLIHVASGAEGGDGSTEQPFGDPVEAVRAAGTGDVVLVGDGTYEVTDDRCACGLAFETEGVTLAAENPGNVTLEPGPDAVDGLVLRTGDIAVVGLRLRGFRDGIIFGSESNPVRNLVLQDLVLEGSGILMGLAESEEPAGPLVDGLLVADTVIAGGEAPIIGINCAQGPCENVRVSGVTIALLRAGGENSGADAIGIESGDNVVVEATETTGADADGIDVKASRVAVVNSRVHHVGRNGVKLWRGGDVINTIVSDTGADAAVVFEEAARYRILHSVVARHSLDADAYAATVNYDRTESGRFELVNSVFYDDSGALWISGRVEADLRNSIFFDSGNEQLVVWARDPEILVAEGEGFAALEEAGGGSDNMEADPGFVDAEAGDFHLGPGSPGIGGGTADVEEYVGFDFDGRPRGEGSAPDVGPYQAP